MATKQDRVEQLRRRAESRLARALDLGEFQTDARGLLHELQVQQVELEFQNDALLESQLELQESRDLYQALFDEAPVGYLILDPEGRVLQANQTASRLLQVEREQLVDRRLQVFAPDPQHVLQLNAHLSETFAAGQSEGLQLSLRRGEADTLHVRLDSRSVGGSPPESARCRTALIDLTVQRRVEHALAERSQRLLDSLETAQLLERQLAEAKRLEVIGRLAGGVAHDFNNMLTVISGSAELALSRLPPDHAIRQELERILLAGRRSARLTSQLLAIGRRQLLSPQRLDLTTLVEETGALLGTTLGPNIRVSFTPPEDSLFVDTDPGGLQQGLVNLAINARDAMPEGGNLKLSLDRVVLDEAEACLYVGARPGPYALLAVCDDGVGMDPATRERIFEPFFSTKQSGTGLGLASLQGYVSQSGGFVSVDSSPSRGTTVRLHLPAVDGPPEQPVEEISSELVSGPGGCAVLLVEDEAILRELFTEVLRDAGYEVVSAAGGEEGLRHFRERPQPFDLVVLDVLMPGMNGVELAERLRGIAPECQFIFMSGFAAEDLVERIGRDIGGVLLQKPLSPARLVQEVLRVFVR